VRSLRLNSRRLEDYLESQLRGSEQTQAFLRDVGASDERSKGSARILGYRKSVLDLLF
jgi:hypothetical protein